MSFLKNCLLGILIMVFNVVVAFATILVIGGICVFCIWVFRGTWNTVKNLF